MFARSLISEGSFMSNEGGIGGLCLSFWVLLCWLRYFFASQQFRRIGHRARPYLCIELRCIQLYTEQIHVSPDQRNTRAPVAAVFMLIRNYYV